VQALSAAAALTELNMERCLWLSDAALAHLARCHTLAKLSIQECNQDSITDATLTLLGRLPSLRSLHMAVCTQRTLTDTGFGALAQSQSLQELDMAQCNQETISDAALAALGRMPALRVLNMRSCHQCTITDAGFAALAQSRSLEELDMSGCRQESITDVALEHLSRCATLTVLTLFRCNQSAFSAAGVRALASSRSLCVLNIEGTQLWEHAALLGESGSLCELLVTLPLGERATKWALANCLLMHAPRLTRLQVIGTPAPGGSVLSDEASEDNAKTDAASAVAALQTAWDVRPAVVKTLRAAAEPAASNEKGEQLAPTLTVAVTLINGIAECVCVLA
jgi:hypothetical protein